MSAPLFVSSPPADTSKAGVLLPSGRYVQAITDINGTGIKTKNREYCVGLLLAQTFDRIAFRIANTPDSGAVIRLGIRADSNGTPGAPLLDQTVAADGGAAWKSLSTTYVHGGGVLWLSWTSQNWTTTGPSLAHHNATDAGLTNVPLVSAASRTTLDWATGHCPIVGYQDSVSGALGSTFTNAATTTTEAMVVALRRA